MRLPSKPRPLPPQAANGPATRGTRATNAWILLAFAIVAEVAGTTAMKLSRGFEVWQWTVALTVCYVVSFYLLALALKRIEIGVAYAIWAGAGTALVALIGIAVFNEAMTTVRVVSLTAIIAGVVGLNLSGGHA